jgi:outer membrane protein assembly factor BamA
MTSPRALFLAATLCLLQPAGHLRAQDRDLVIGSIDFDGNKHIKDDRLKRVISIKEESSYPESAFDSAAFSVDMKKIVGLYVSEGFRACRGEGVGLDYNGDSTGADLTVRISEGPPTVVDTIVVTGNAFFTRDELLDMLTFGRGDRYEREKATSGKIAIGTAYKTAGFLDVRVEVDAAWGSADDTCAVAYTITEYTRFAIDSIRVEGLVDVKPHLLTREFRFAPGEFVDLEALATSQRLMYETNLFRTVSIKPVPPADSTSPKKDLQVRITEEDPGKLELSFGFGSIDKVRAGALLSYNNTFGEGYRSSLGGKVSAIEQTARGCS